MNNSSIYFDNNSSAAVDPSLVEYLNSVISELFSNPSSPHHPGRSIKNLLIKSRDLAASFLQVRPSELIFTSSGTESVNMAIRGITGFKTKGHIITSLAEHSCVIAACKLLENAGFSVTYLKPGSYGAVTIQAVVEAIRADTILIALMAANNETGVKTDIALIAQIAKEHQIPFFVDAVALLGKEPIEIPEGVSAMSFSGHKIHALQGIGALFLKTGVKCKPLIVGGEQEMGRRAGTENVIGILSFGKACEILLKDGLKHYAKMKLLRDTFESILLKHLNNVVINGEGERVSNVSNVAFMGVDGETLLLQLDSLGIYASHGAACSSGALEPSRVLTAMGLPIDRVRSSIRFSFSRMNSLEEVDEACKKIIALVKAY